MADAAKESVLKFRLETENRAHDVFKQFYPQGKTLLNRTEWMGKPPRSCGVTRVRGEPYFANHTGPVGVEVEVSYRPKGCITYVGGTRYDGWTAMLMDKTKDGQLLDGHGKPLPPGAKPVYLPYELYEDTDFNEINFGTFVGEFPVERVRRVSAEEVEKAIQATTRFNAAAHATFLAARRARPAAQIVIMDDIGPNQPKMSGPDRIVFIDRANPHLSQVVLDTLTEFLGGFFEGRYSMGTLTIDEFTLLKLDHVLVDVIRENGKQESQFNCLDKYLTEKDMYELATRLMATYEIVLEMVVGEKPGFILRRPDPENPLD